MSQGGWDDDWMGRNAGKVFLAIVLALAALGGGFTWLGSL